MCNMDNVIIIGETQGQHGKYLIEVLHILEFSKCSLKYLDHIISFEDIKAAQDKVSAIKNMSPPTDVSGVRQFFDMM